MNKVRKVSVGVIGKRRMFDGGLAALMAEGEEV